MQLLSIASRKGVLAGLALLAAASAAFLLLGSLPPSGDQDSPPPADPLPSPAEVIVLRFPEPGSAEPARAGDLPLPPAQLVTPLTSLLLGGPEAGQIYDRARQYVDPNAAGSATAPPRTTLRSPRSMRASNLLNEGQIASIKARLKLTPDQQAYWPPVETALRELAWRHPHERPGTKALPSLERDSLERLQASAAPLLMRLREDQKRELRLLAHIIGLEKLVSQF